MKNKFTSGPFFKILFYTITVLIVSGCKHTPLPVTETRIKLLPLSGPVADDRAELSGLAWYGNNLILLPQYPDRFGNSLFSLTRQQLLNALNNNQPEPLKPAAIPFDDKGISLSIDNFEGYEAIIFSGDTVFLSVEAKGKNKTESYLVSGRIDSVISKISLQKNSLVKIPDTRNYPNMGFETLVSNAGNVVAIYEANGTGQQSAARVFSKELNYNGSIRFPEIAYRITDATGLMTDKTFWAINYFYPGEKFLKPRGVEKLTAEFGAGNSHRSNKVVERLLHFKFDNDQIVLLDEPPVYLELDPTSGGRNWEGIAFLENKGFLLVTDKFPHTYLAFIEFNN